MTKARARAPTLAVLLREARRQSRRPATHLLRISMATVVLGGLVLLTFVLTQEEVDPARFGEIARVCFILTTMLGLGVTTLLAPLLVALGVVEEKDEGTLDLLAITRLSSWQILLGKASVRLLVLATVIVGVVPALTILLSYGGVGPGELVAAVAQVAVLAGLLAIVGGFLAIEARNVVLPYLLTGVWAVAALLVAPVLYLEWLQIPAFTPYHPGLDPKIVQLAETSPVFAAFLGSRWSALGAAAWAPAALVLTALSPATFRVATARLGEAGRRTWDERFLVAFQAGSWLLVLAAIAVTVWLEVGKPPLGVHTARVGWAYRVLLQTAGTVAFVRVAMALIAASSGRAGAAWSILPRVRLHGLRKWLPLRNPRGNPILWREVATRAHGGAGAAAAVVVLVWAAFVGWLAYEASLTDDDVWAVVVLTALGASLTSTVVLATASAVEERTTDQLDLLLLTTLPRWRILSGKLQAVLLRSAVPLALVLVAHANRIWWGPMLPYEPTDLGDPYMGWYYGYSPLNHDHSWYGANPFAGLPSLRYGAMIAWFSLVLLLAALCALGVGLKVKSSRVAWVVNLLGLAGVPTALMAFATGAAIVHSLTNKLFKVQLLPDKALPFHLVFPFISDGWLECDYGTPWEVLFTVAVLFVIDGVVFLVLATWLRRWGGRWFGGG